MSAVANRKEEETESCLELAGKYLTFKLGDEFYGIEILKVQEIIKMMEITRVPRMPDFVRGVINLRGRVVPIIDLRLKFDMEKTDVTRMTCIIVVKIPRGDDNVIMGTVVDEVSEVKDISGSDIQPTPSMGAAVDTRFILGVAKTGETVTLLLDVDGVLAENEVKTIQSVAR